MSLQMVIAALKLKDACLFFVAPWSPSATSEWSWTSLSQPLAARSSLKWTMNENFIPSTRSIWPQKLLLTLWVENGRVMWSESVARMISRVSPWSRVSWPMTEFACHWVRGIPVRDQGGLERENANLYGVVLWMPIWVFSTWSSWKKGRRIFLDSLILQCLVAWVPKELAESANFSISLKKMMSASMLCESP